jgi:hypothetical protein
MSEHHGLSAVHRDPQTGENHWRIPMPSPAMPDRALQSIATLLCQCKQWRLRGDV